MNEFKIHTLALAIAVIGPLINFWIKPFYKTFIFSPYLYWTVALSIYVGFLVPFVSKSPLRLARLMFLGIPVEDFSSNLWSSMLGDRSFLSFPNWYAKYFPFFNVIGQSTPFLLIPVWYILAISAYLILTFVQYRKQIPAILKTVRKKHLKVLNKI